MSNVRGILSKYFDILEGNRIPNYIQCKHTPISFNSNESTASLWQKHDTTLQNIKLADVIPTQSLLDLKIELAYRIFKNCCFCERKCQVNREKTKGNCGVKEPQIVSEFLHIGEESILVPSYTVFFSGCTFHCVFCQNWDISQQNRGLYVNPKTLAEMIVTRKIEGAKNVNWVGGDPTPNLPYIFSVLKESDTNIPQVWNSNMYCSLETMKLLNGIFDMYLTDFKYGNDECANRLSKVDNYLQIVQRNHEIAYQQGEIIVRHLVMPNHIECCSEPILNWIQKNITDVIVNIMAQYRPEYKAYDYNDISRSVSMDEFMQAKLLAKKLQINEI